MSDDCCRAAVAGEDSKFFLELEQLLAKLESRPDDKVIQDMSIITKRQLYDRVVAQASRLHTHSISTPVFSFSRKA